MITIGFFASVATGAAASASGVKPKPARKSTLSRVTSSCARRFATSGLGPPVSRMTTRILRPANVSPCSLKKALIPPSICLPNWAAEPENGAMTPTFTSWAPASVQDAATTRAAAWRIMRPPGVVANDRVTAQLPGRSEDEVEQAWFRRTACHAGVHADGDFPGQGEAGGARRHAGRRGERAPDVPRQQARLEGPALDRGRQDRRASGAHEPGRPVHGPAQD